MFMFPPESVLIFTGIFIKRLKMKNAYKLFLCLICIVLCGGCNSMSFSPQESRGADEQAPIWGLSFGRYDSRGTLVQIGPKRWEYISVNEFDATMQDHIMFDLDVNVEVKKLNNKSLDYKILNQIQYQDDLVNKLIIYNNLNYAVLSCKEWQLQAFSLEQFCTGTMPHINQKSVNTFGMPLKIRVWLPYFNQTLTLTHLEY